MADITTRAGKGGGLTNSEMDANFININKDLDNSIKASIPWVASTSYAKGITLQFESRYYLVSTGGITGTVAPTHVTGTVANGSTQLQYIVPSAYSPKDVLDKIKLVHGVGSGLDSDTVDGLNATQIIEQSVSESLALAIALG